MTSSLRIARRDPSGLRSLIKDPAAIHSRLQATIRRHLPAVTASLLAEPKASADGTGIDWYSDLAGEPVPLSDLSEQAQVRARSVLSDRLASLSRLADELPEIAADSVDLAKDLRAATQFPGEDYVYLVGGQPVIICWGYLPAGGPRAYAAQGIAANVAAVAGASGHVRGRSLWPWLALLVLLLAGIAGMRVWFDNLREQELMAELQTALADGCGPGERLDALYRRLLALDPAENRYPAIWERLTAARQRCASADRFREELLASRGDCARLAQLREALASWHSDEPPFTQIVRQFDEALAVCAAAAGFAERLESAQGDCRMLADIARELGLPPEAAVPLLRVRARLDGELDRCADAERLRLELGDIQGNCPELQRLDGELMALDTSRPPLDGVRAELDLELALCETADHYAEAILQAHSDCTVLAQLDRDIRKEPIGREPLRSVQVRLADLLSQCSALGDLAQALADARGDCAKLALLERRVAQEGSRNPLFTEVKQALLEELRGCELATALDQAVSDAAGDCEALAALEPRFASLPQDDARFRSPLERWRQARAGCMLAETLRRKLVAAGDDCARLAALKPDLSASPAETPGIDSLLTRFSAAFASCERPPAPVVAEAPTVDVPPKEPTKAPPATRARIKDRKILCPGERPKELAPQLVMVFDASASMDRPIAESAALTAVRRGLQMGGLAGAALGMLMEQAAREAQGPRRIDAAKDAAGRIVDSLPGDVDVGLVLVEDCPAARPIGFYAPGQRRSLVRGIQGIHPVGGTPLAAGIERAANMVDGVQRPAVMVILSDGKESCKRDPCAVARQVARRKPQLIINVVDIAGTGAGNCAAQATGGKVYTANNAAEIRAMMQRATQEVRGPAECSGKRSHAN